MRIARIGDGTELKDIWRNFKCKNPIFPPPETVIKKKRLGLNCTNKKALRSSSEDEKGSSEERVVKPKSV